MKNHARRYWLMKTEPGCFSLADLESTPNATASWDGVRNYQARNYLRDSLRPGDDVLFYHSNIPRPAIVGLAEVVNAGYPDDTALDPNQAHFDPNATSENPIWFMVDVRFRVRPPHPLTRETLAAHPVLSAMGVLKKGNRLSVQPVTTAEWQAVLDLSGLRDPLVAEETEHEEKME